MYFIVELMVVTDDEMMGEEEQEGSDLTLKFQHLHWQRQDELGVASLTGGKKARTRVYGWYCRPFSS